MGDPNSLPTSTAPALSWLCRSPPSPGDQCPAAAGTNYPKLAALKTMELQKARRPDSDVTGLKSRCGCVCRRGHMPQEVLGRIRSVSSTF